MRFYGMKAWLGTQNHTGFLLYHQFPEHRNRFRDVPGRSRLFLLAPVFIVIVISADTC